MVSLWFPYGFPMVRTPTWRVARVFPRPWWLGAPHVVPAEGALQIQAQGLFQALHCLPRAGSIQRLEKDLRCSIYGML